ncbi:Ribosomal protein S18 acetylase RimI [Rhizobiales bacterium GAS191]|nr:Ribosomal protein S18 acetylase RimI [Rhizobiales bacterium GAS113]SED08119.1 Ribosomal protein S18 acetylase RimI [Rhizobiales bacterium GAS191]
MPAASASVEELLVRPVGRDELPAIRSLLVETWHDTYDVIYGIAEVTKFTEDWHSLANLARGLAREQHAFLVLEADGEIVATASATLRDSAALQGDGLLSIDRLYVRPARQGSGFGSALLDACVARFPEARSVHLEVDPHNRKGREFYAKRGFAETRVPAGGEEGNVLCERRVAAWGLRERPYMLLRPARDDDAQELFGLIALCFADYPGCYVDPHDDLRDLLKPAVSGAEREGRFWVVEDRRARIGACVSVDFPQPRVAELHRVYVRQDLRRRGLAAKLVGLAESEARGRGAERMVFWSDTRFLDAHRFYERLGYRRTGEERELGDISHSREFRFEKQLDEKELR